MKTSLQKSYSHIYVEYECGGWTNSLSGENFVIYETPEELLFEIDLSGNYKVKNKSTNSYLDVHKLSEDHGSLKYIQVDEDQVLKGLGAARSRNPNATWKLSLIVGGLGTYQYEIKPEKISTGYQFNVVKA